MPIYEYECRGCGNRFEFLVLPSSSPPACPACHHEDLQRLISLCAVSSESTRQAHLSSARKKSAEVQREKQHEEHKHIHEHD
ncbi:MAG: FmdB family transcriptional regulator [Acidobacteria bacterium]|nr:MAG: FmdB family transcriptional regulator [Acidobacteriota bacterium]